MRIVFLILSMFIGFVSYAQTISVRNIEPTNKEPIVLPKYDTTFVHLNFDKLYNNLRYYNGQKILFSPNIDNKTIYSHYTGFHIKDSVEMLDYPDTVWIKKRKKVKPGDFYVIYPKTATYKPEYISNGVVRTIGENKYPHYALSRKSGFYTPCKYVDGQIFTIVGISKIRSSSSIDRIFCMHLLDAEGNNVDLTCNTSFSYYKKDEYFPSILMVSFIDKYRELYVGKKFHAKDVSGYIKKEYLFKDIETDKYVSADGDLTCTDISLVRGKSSFVKLDNSHESVSATNVRLFFKNKDGKEFCIPIETEYNTSIALTKDLYENYDYAKMYYHIQLDDMILADDYYAQKEAARVAKEKKLAEEERAKQERKVKLIKKYGKNYADLIIQRRVKIGMTAEMCREAWGSPNDINRSTGPWGVHEQWCYDWGGYLYMENGKLTSIQN